MKRKADSLTSTQEESEEETSPLGMSLVITLSQQYGLKDFTIEANQWLEKGDSLFSISSSLIDNTPSQGTITQKKTKKSNVKIQITTKRIAYHTYFLIPTQFTLLNYNQIAIANVTRVISSQVFHNYPAMEVNFMKDSLSNTAFNFIKDSKPIAIAITMAMKMNLFGTQENRLNFSVLYPPSIKGISVIIKYTKGTMYLSEPGFAYQEELDEIQNLWYPDWLQHKQKTIVDKQLPNITSLDGHENEMIDFFFKIIQRILNLILNKYQRYDENANEENVFIDVKSVYIAATNPVIKK